MTNNLHSQYIRAKIKRAQWVTLGFLVGVFGIGALTFNLYIALAGGLLLSIFVSEWKSREVKRLEDIIYLGGEK